MKSKHDPRHLRRIKNFQAIFASDFGVSNPTTDDSSSIKENLTKIDETISKSAPKWPLNKINKVDLAILRCAIWELNFQKQTPDKVIIDEAIELGKEFGNDSSPKFINAVLGASLKHES